MYTKNIRFISAYFLFDGVQVRNSFVLSVVHISFVRRDFLLRHINTFFVITLSVWMWQFFNDAPKDIAGYLVPSQK